MSTRELIEAVEANELLETDWSFGRWPEHLSWDQVSAAYHGSVDAALALMQAVLPGHGLFELHEFDDGMCLAAVERRADATGFSAVSDTPARALLLAILKAMDSTARLDTSSVHQQKGDLP